MQLREFDFSYPSELIAHHPMPERDASRMLVLDRATGAMKHSCVRNLPDYLQPGDVLVINTSKVIPARLIGRRESGGIVEILLLESGNGIPSPLGGEGKGEGNKKWFCITTRTNRLKIGTRITFAEGLVGEVLDRVGDRLAINFNSPLPPLKLRGGERGSYILSILEHIGLPPLPPYIERPDGIEPSDRERYQTIYADTPGSAAAPTAGLHFTPALIGAIRARGVTIAPVTLHVSTDTFSPVRVDRIEDHQMHGERYDIPAETISAIAAAKRDGRRIIAVGTTSVRALEAGVMDGTTRLFITPGYRFRIVDALITNFHQPRSTLLMLVSAFAGIDIVRRAYAEAIAQRYRLFSYGDAMLIF